MRNCFVPGCDSYCKANNCSQRKMFFAPKEMFEKWKEKLANKREFKKNDRVCERHFEPNQIIEYWENKINGVIHKTQREKPKLAQTALPTLNIPDWDEFSLPTIQKRQIEKVKVLHEQIIKRIPPEEMKRVPQKPPVKRLKTDSNEIVPNTQQAVPKTIKAEKVDEENLELFENLYDEVHDVTLPNTLYGINRCPDRQFIVFNQFNFKSMGFKKFLFIDSSLNCKVYINGNVELTKLAKDKCNTEFISEWLDKIDKA
ncbi:uncharacterized protein [Chironomus tepperi]|uniref:uncharacterized protein n=1 Tax=Chironomus tepperi TaxID=113505 RepID=UPI00391F029C